MVKRNNPEKVASLFSKRQLLSAKRFRERRDIIDALLSSEKQYTMQEVEEKIERYMKGRVK